MRYIEILENELILNNPKFKEWFSGSKVIDSKGNPLKLYTGTSKDMDFKKFKCENVSQIKKYFKFTGIFS